jgi:elongation factor P
MKTAIEVRTGNLLLIDEKIYKVEEVEVKGSAKAARTINLKMKCITADKHIDHTYQQDDKFEEADVHHQKAIYSYDDETFYYFIDETTYDNYPISKEIVGNKSVFLKENDEYTIEVFEGKAIDVLFPERIQLKVTSSPPGIKQHDSTTAKQVTLENGMRIDAPQFIEEGDLVEIDSHTGKYIDRVKK